MDKRQEAILEWELYKAIRAFLECVDDKEEKKRMVKKAILEFNEEYGTTTEEVIAKLKTMLKEQLLGVLDTLTPREEKVLRLRYGLDDSRPRTLEEVGKEFNVTRERIRQIEAKALRKLRHPSRSKRLKDFLD